MGGFPLEQLAGRHRLEAAFTELHPPNAQCSQHRAAHDLSEGSVGTSHLPLVYKANSKLLVKTFWKDLMAHGTSWELPKSQG